MKYSLWTIMCLLLGSGTYATGSLEHNEQLFEQANLAYKLGAYDSAKALYAEVVNNGYESAELFYNLGNTYYKDANLPAAILYFERALKIAPKDEDIAYNLEVANSFITDKIEPVEPVFISAWWTGLAKSMTPTAWGWTFIALLTLLCVLVTLFVMGRSPGLKQLGFLAGLVTFFACAIALSLGFKSKALADKTEAIVFSPSVNVKSEPGLGATVQFVVHEGLKVEVIDEDSEWLRIELADGNSGWLPATSVERI